MARVAGVNIPDKKQAWVSLTHIFGIGKTTALKICLKTGISQDTKIGTLEEADLEKLRKAVAEFAVEGDLRRDISTNIKRLMDLGTNRGIRHRRSCFREIFNYLLLFFCHVKSINISRSFG